MFQGKPEVDLQVECARCPVSCRCACNGQQIDDFTLTTLLRGTFRVSQSKELCRKPAGAYGGAVHPFELSSHISG